MYTCEGEAQLKTVPRANAPIVAKQAQKEKNKEEPIEMMIKRSKEIIYT